MPTKAENLVQAAEEARNRGLGRVLTGLAIKGCGPSMSHKLAERFQSMDRLMLFAWAYCEMSKRGWPFRRAWQVAEAYCWECYPEKS